MNDANQSIRNPANSGATVDTQDDARGQKTYGHTKSNTLKTKIPLNII